MYAYGHVTFMAVAPWTVRLCFYLSDKDGRSCIELTTRFLNLF